MIGTGCNGEQEGEGNEEAEQGFHERQIEVSKRLSGYLDNGVFGEPSLDRRRDIKIHVFIRARRK